MQLLYYLIVEVPSQNVESAQPDYAGLNAIQQEVQGQENLSRASLQKIRTEVTPGIKLAAIRRLRSTHEEGQSDVVLETIRLANILGLGEKDPQGAEILNTLSSLYPPSPQVPNPSRRKLLKNAVKFTVAGGVAATIPPAVFTGVDPEVRAAAQASLARPRPPSTEDKFEELSETILASTYERYFKDREHILSKDAWMRNQPVGFGRWIATLANIYYHSEKGKRESFDAYYIRFMEHLYDAAKLANLDFAVFVSSLQVSAQNIYNLDQYKADVFPVGIVQMLGVSLARRFGMRYQLQEGMQSYGPIPKALEALQNSPLKDKITMPGEEWNINAIMRVPYEVTTGMMDFEPSMRARALLLFGTDELKQIFKQQYPEIVKSYQTILTRLGVPFTPIIREVERPKETLGSTKRKVEELAKGYIQNFGHRLNVFAEDDAALATIGIGEPLDPWQKFNRTDIWYELVRHREKRDDYENERRAVSEVRQMLRQSFNHERQRYYQNLMSQQVLNPKFISFLLERAQKEGQLEEVAALSRIQEAVKEYGGQVNSVREAFFLAVKEESPFEYDSQFQTLASAVTTKMLSSEAGPFDPNSKDSLYWNVYRLLSIRELSHPFTMVRDTGFANDVLVDPPYAIRKTFEYLDMFEQLLLEKGVLASPAKQDVFSMDRAIQSIRRNDFSEYPHLRNEDQQFLFEFCRYHITEGGEVAINRANHVLWIAA